MGGEGKGYLGVGGHDVTSDWPIWGLSEMRRTLSLVSCDIHHDWS